MDVFEALDLLEMWNHRTGPLDNPGRLPWSPVYSGHKECGQKHLPSLLPRTRVFGQSCPALLRGSVLTDVPDLRLSGLYCAVK